VLIQVVGILCCYLLIENPPRTYFLPSDIEWDILLRGCRFHGGVVEDIIFWA
jgi:hypothetical protein